MSNMCLTERAVGQDKNLKPRRKFVSIYKDNYRRRTEKESVMKKGRAKPISDLLKAKDLLNVRYVYGHDGASREGRCILSLIGSCRRAKSMSMLDKTCDVLYIDCDTSFKYASSFIVYICSFSSNGILHNMFHYASDRR